ncbi:putative toxin biosynthesis protein [Hypoxylon sp. FL1284]|nr:putative toxin biosynthesis protein [Hypoxylon sp. FL1284]
MAPAFPFHVKEHVVPAQHVREWPRATANSQDDVLYLSVKQYVPVDNPDPRPGDVTILAAHANGFPKELYEPLWADLHAICSSSSAGKGEGEDNEGFRIRGIWSADVSNQGYSGTLNERAQGDDPSWDDHARDLLHLTNVFRSEMPRPLVGVGHSFGGAVLTRLSLLHPRLLSTLVLLDPTITAFSSAPVGPGKSVARASAFRRESWPDRAAAAASFRRSPFYRAWDPRVLDAWIEHGLRPAPTALVPSDDPAAGATLRTPKHQELFTYFRPLWPYVQSPSSLSDGTSTIEVDKDGAPDFDPADARTATTPTGDASMFPFYRSEGGSVLRQLPAVRPSVLWVFGGDSDLGDAPGRKLKTETCGAGPGGSGGLARGRVAEVVVQGRGHLFPMEVPALCARHAAAWIAPEMARWRAAQRAYEDWARRPLRDKTTLSPEFLDRVGRPPSRTADKSLVGAESKL